MQNKENTAPLARLPLEPISLRDYFAGQALAGLCADCNAYLPPREMARASYDLADAMLAARGPQ